jgi:hypothetical protein
VLPLDDFVTSQVGDVGDTDLGSWLEDHPSAVKGSHDDWSSKRTHCLERTLPQSTAFDTYI